MEQITVRTVDLETTDFPPEGAVVELGYVDTVLERYDSSVRWSVKTSITNKTQMFLDPGPEKQMSLEARATHHIGEHEYRGAKSASELNDLVYVGGPNILAAHAADFEKSYIETRPGVFWVDTYKVALRLFPDFKRHSNQFMRYALGLDLADDDSMPPHRALPDAFTTANLFMAMLTLDGCTLKQMIQWSSEPPYITKFSFGKYFGQKIEEAPRDYLQWILGQQSFDPGVVAACQRVLYGEKA